MFEKDTHQVYRVRELEALSWLEHGFGTRTSLDWPPPSLVTLKQVHSDLCVPVDATPGIAGAADGLASATPGCRLAIRTADCIPILIADERQRAVAAVHAGWRGTASEIARKAVETMASHFGSRPEDLHAAIGPGICEDCYTVGAEVASRFQALFPERQDLNGPANIDLVEANRRQLLAAGIPPARIYGSGLCTHCRAEEFHSHRRTPGKAGRMVSVIGIRLVCQEMERARA